MSDEVNIPMLRERLHNYSAVAYTQVSGLMLSGIFALGAIALLDILRNPDHRILRLSFWLMMTLGEVAAAMIQMQRPALMRRSGVEEIPVLVFRGILALLAYAVIAPQSGGIDGWRYAYGLGIPFLLANGFLNLRFRRALGRQKVTPELSAIMDPVLKVQTALTDRFPVFAAFLAALLALTALSPRTWLFVEWVSLIYNLLAVLLIATVGMRLQQAWIAFENAIENHTEREPADSDDE